MTWEECWKYFGSILGVILLTYSDLGGMLGVFWEYFGSILGVILLTYSDLGGMLEVFWNYFGSNFINV